MLTLSAASERKNDLSTVNIRAYPQENHHLPFPPVSDRSYCEQTAEQPTVSLMTDVIIETISRLESECITFREEHQKLKLKIQGVKTLGNFLDNPSKVCDFTGIT